jgi:ABC-2 type transport system permease protein
MKPASGFVSVLFREVGWHIISSVVGLITSLILLYSFPNNVFLIVPLINIFFIFLALTIAILVTFSFSFDMALLAFWFTDVGAIESFFWMGRSVLGGATIPISFLPLWAKNLVIFLPFRYMFSFPLEILFNKVNLIEIFQGLLIGIIWIVFLYYLYHYLWEKGRRIYSAFGQ